jgi:hypothetical protein
MKIKFIKEISPMEPISKNTFSTFCTDAATISCSGRYRTRAMLSVSMVAIAVLASVSGFSSSSLFAEDDGDVGVHLFILSGQSNMAGMKPEESFTPAVEKAFGKDNVIVVKDAHGGQPIRRWYKDWKSVDGNRPDKTGDLYDRLMQKVKSEMKAGGKSIKTATFVWMQGERDANEKHGDIYGDSLNGLFGQLASDLGRNDLNFVIGRLSDFDMQNQKYPHWTLVRNQQVALAKGNSNCVWVDTDDLNDGKNRRGQMIKNDLHYSADGYVILGQRFADEAIRMVNSRTEPKVGDSATSKP